MHAQRHAHPGENRPPGGGRGVVGPVAAEKGEARTAICFLGGCEPRARVREEKKNDVSGTDRLILGGTQKSAREPPHRRHCRRRRRPHPELLTRLKFLGLRSEDPVGFSRGLPQTWWLGAA
jgi:hypothetical protein